MTSTGQKDASGSSRLSSTAERIWADLMEGNKRFREGKPATRELVERRAELASGQNPQAILLACSDSRVAPNLIFDSNVGDLFVIRTAGNVADTVALGSIEFAAEYLNSEVLVVLGHENCGAVAAAASGAEVPSANLESVVAKVGPAIDCVKGQGEGDALLRLAEKANVLLSASDILRNSPLLRQKVAEGKLAVIKALYQLTTGRVVLLAE